jgi:hypothetical protein
MRKKRNGNTSMEVTIVMIVVMIVVIVRKIRNIKRNTRRNIVNINIKRIESPKIIQKIVENQ